MKITETGSRRWLPGLGVGGVESECLMRTEFQVDEMKSYGGGW